jgi:hypothetical protein
MFFAFCMPVKQRFSCPGIFCVAVLFVVLFQWVTPVVAALTPWTLSINTNNVVYVTNYTGLVTNYGAADAIWTAAIQSAINDAAAGGTTNGLSGGTVELTAGTYLSGPITLKTCVNLKLDTGAILRMLPFGSYPAYYVTNSGNGAVWVTNVTDFITASSQHDLSITGSGAIDGQGAAWWPWYKTNGSDRPVMIRLSGCNRQLVQGVTLSNSPMFHLAFSSSAGNITVQGVTIRAPSSGASPASHNTDACDVSGTNILVRDCDISVGDDNFTCGGNTWDVLITNNTYGDGHGVSIGSYTSPTVSNITVVNCTFNDTDQGIRIKTDNDRGGVVQNINYYNLSMTNVNFPILIYQYYNEVGTPSSISPLAASTQTVSTVTSLTPVYRNITISNITATAVSGYPAVLIWGRMEMPMTNIVLKKVKISAQRPCEIYSASQVQIIDSQITTAAGSNTFWLYNSQVTLSNSASGASSVWIDGLQTNGYASAFKLYSSPAWLKNTNLFDDGPLTIAGCALTVSNHLALAPSTVLNYVLGANPATVAVVSNLVLGGTINIVAGNGYTNGVYTLLTYGGTCSGSVSLGTAPAAYNYAITNGSGKVNLLVSATCVNPTAVVSGGGTVCGGSSVAIQAALTGTQPWNVTWSDGVVQSGVGSSLATRVVSPAANTTYTVTALSDASGCSAGTLTGSASVTLCSSSAKTNSFVDVFTNSPVNAVTSLPTAASTCYSVLSSKSYSPTPSSSTNHLKFGIGGTTSGCIEVQALFATNAFSLLNIGDSIVLSVTFSNTSGLLMQSNLVGFGLYNSGQAYPVTNGLNGTATSAYSTNATGCAQNWIGYVGQLANSGGGCRIMNRLPQSGTANNNQDLVTSGSGSSSYSNPGAATVGSAVTSSLALSASAQYTEVLTILLAATNTLAITNTFYSGGDATGTLLSQFGAVAGGTNYLTNSFDALAVGWRAMTNTYVTAMDINRIAVTAINLGSGAAAPSLVRTNLSYQVSGGQLQLSWPSDHVGWYLQVQTNAAGSGLGSNWATLPASNITNTYSLPVGLTNGSVFLRMVYTN